MSPLSRSHVIGHAIGFNVLWFAAVIGASQGQVLPAYAALAGLFCWGALLGRHWRRDLQLAIAGVLFSLTLEPIWLSQGRLQYALQGELNLPPGWITALWAAFAISFCHSLRWLQGRWILAALIGGIGGMLSLTAGVRLGAVEMPQGAWSLAAIYAPIWALATPALAWLAQRLERLAATGADLEGALTADKPAATPPHQP